MLLRYIYDAFKKQLLQDVQIIKQIIIYRKRSIVEEYQSYKEKKDIITKMGLTQSYDQWKQYAQLYDNQKDILLWKQNMHSNDYDYEYIQHLRDQLQIAKLQQNYHKRNTYQLVIHIIRSHAFRNPANILASNLYNHCFIGTKSLIQSFRLHLRQSLVLIANAQQVQLSKKKKLEFFLQTRHALGRSALLLSGGAILGMYHIGVLKCLQQQGLIPKIICGSSAGSLIASFLAVKGVQKVLLIYQFFRQQEVDFSAFQGRIKGSVKRKLKRFFTLGYLMDISVLQQFLRDNLGDITFQQAFDKTGYILNITVTGQGKHDSDRILNYLTSPNGKQAQLVLIWSASAASCAIPYIYGSAQIYCKNQNGDIQTYVPMKRRFLDGSIGADLPMQKLSIMFNVNCFIVSQTNPWVVPFKDYEYFRHSTNMLLSCCLDVLDFFKHVILAQIKYRASQLMYLGLLPQQINKLLNLLIQTYSGDVTIYPVPTFSDYLNILQNPTGFEQIQKFIKNGKKQSFKKINYIRYLLDFEKTVNQCCNMLRESYNYNYMDRLSLQKSQQQQYQELMKQSQYLSEQNLKKNYYPRNNSFFVPRNRSKFQFYQK